MSVDAMSWPISCIGLSWMTKMMRMYDWEFVNDDKVDWFRDLRLYVLW